MDYAVNTAVNEYNSYGLAATSAQLKIAERDVFGMKAPTSEFE